ncbi:MAG: ATP-binding protein [Candidatus Bathyarchaeia archaeon]
MSKTVGVVISGGNNEAVQFVIADYERVLVNHYYFLKHPLHKCNVLLATYSIQPYNPEMTLGRPGLLTAKRGILTQSGRNLESHIAHARILGYFNGKRKWRPLEVAAPVGAEVLEPSEEELKEFFTQGTSEHDALYAEMGSVQGTNIPVRIDLNAIAKSHMLVAGMTRAGKSSFIINLALKAERLNPRPHIIIFDRRREYTALAKNPRVQCISYRAFVPGGCSPSVAVKRLGLTGKDADIFHRAMSRLSSNGSSEEQLMACIREEAELRYKKGAESCIQYLSKLISSRGGFLFERRGTVDIINLIEHTSTLIIDFSTDGDVEAQHRACADIVRKIMRYAIRHRGYFAVILCIEEAQYFAPERGVDIGESPAQSEAKAQLIEAISQLGGYNVGVVVMTQRPAYVAKAVLSQCNSVACFRLKSGNDQDAILNYSEYGSDQLRYILPGLADHEALLWGLALETPFPVVAEIDVEAYPQKAIVSAKRAWQEMDANGQGSTSTRVLKPTVEEAVTVES